MKSQSVIRFPGTASRRPRRTSTPPNETMQEVEALRRDLRDAQFILVLIGRKLTRAAKRADEIGYRVLDAGLQTSNDSTTARKANQ
ncbi:MAG: hypothetical protein H0W72_06980 [Planctomycetes bacterium]|nr:hypothetical protein [Planctomycetota bacterium]